MRNSQTDWCIYTGFEVRHILQIQQRIFSTEGQVELYETRKE